VLEWIHKANGNFQIVELTKPRMESKLGLPTHCAPPLRAEDTKMATAQNIADHILWSSHESGSFISNLKLQKLLYYVQSWHLAINDSALFSEKFEAWVHGPAIPEIYRRYKRFSWRSIDEEVEQPILDDHTRRFVEEVLDEYGHLDARRLEYLTHREEPWISARKGVSEGESCSTYIDESLMKSYYRSRLEEERADQAETLRVREGFEQAQLHEAELVEGEVSGEGQETNIVPS